MVHPPVVTGVSPKEGPPGTRVTIRGEFLGNSANDLVGLKICGCDCLLSAEWKSRNKIIARSGPCKGRGDIIATTILGGEGTSTVQFRGYHESIGPVKESAVWVEETAQTTLSWGRRPLSPTSYAPPDPLGLSTEGDESNKFPEEDLNELFPEGSGKLSDENFHPGWYLLEHHNLTTFEDLKAGAMFLERKVESQKEGQLNFLKSNTSSVMDQLDRLILVKNMFEEDYRQNGKEPLISLQSAIEDSIVSADALFADILARKDKADRTRAALAMLIRHKFLFQLPATIDKNIKKKEYDLVVNDYTRVKNLFGWTEVKLFQRILAEIDKRIFKLKDHLYNRIQTMPITVQEQKKFIRLLLSLSMEEDVGWIAINSRKDYLIELFNKIREHYKQKEQQEIEKCRRKGLIEWWYEWGEIRKAWCAGACAVLGEEGPALWNLARFYFIGDLTSVPPPASRSAQFKEMLISCVELFSSHVRSAILSSGTGPSGSSDNKIYIPSDVITSTLINNLMRLRDAYDALLKLDLPSQPLAIVEKVIYDYRMHGMVTFLQRTVRRVKLLEEKEDWKIDEYTDYGAITKLPHLLENYISETLTDIHKCVCEGGRRETLLLPSGGTSTGGSGGSMSATSSGVAALQRYSQDTLLAYVACLRSLALSHDEQESNTSNLSVALGEQQSDNIGTCEGWQQRLLVAGANARYTRCVSLPLLRGVYQKYGFPEPKMAFQATREALEKLERHLTEAYLEHRGDPLVGTIEPSMFMGKYKWNPNQVAEDATPYIYEIINNLIAVHAEMDSVVGGEWNNAVKTLVETVCEEISRLVVTSGAAENNTRSVRTQAHIDTRALLAVARPLLTAKARNHIKETMASLPPLQNTEEEKLVDKVVQKFSKRMELQIQSLEEAAAEERL